MTSMTSILELLNLHEHGNNFVFNPVFVSSSHQKVFKAKASGSSCTNQLHGRKLLGLILEIENTSLRMWCPNSSL